MKYFIYAMFTVISLGTATTKAEEVVTCVKMYGENKGEVRQFLDYCPRGWRPVS